MKAWKYSGAGNSFVVLDGRSSDCSGYREAQRISALCSAHSTDGLMILSPAEGLDFRMEYFNSDGSGGMMCGNGGRCIVAFADQLGIEPAEPGRYSFVAADGLHTAVVTERNGALKTVSLRMKDVKGAVRYPCLDPIEGVSGWFLDTGTRHFVIFVPDVEAVDVEELGSRVRYHPAFLPQGVNVNFVQPTSFGIKLRTFEKGVEAETLACGTGIVASALAAYVSEAAPAVSIRMGGLRNYNYCVQARRDELSVDFNTGLEGWLASDVHLTGPAELVEEIEI